MNQDLSQFEEFKIISKALEIIGVQSPGWCVEFGAGDGKECSNTFNLIVDKGFSSVQIESNPQEFIKLKETHGDRSGVYLFNEFVGRTKDDGLHILLSKTPCPKDIDFISIDIDGNDTYAWESIIGYHPKLVLIEFNPSFPNHVDWRQENNHEIQRGASLFCTKNVGESLGYELIACTQVNALFVQKEYYELFDISDNSVDLMYNNNPYLTYLAQGYDGELILLGNTRLMWHRIEISQNELQILPKELRTYNASAAIRGINNKRVMTRGDGVGSLQRIPWI